MGSDALAKDKKGKREGLLRKLKGAKQPKYDPELVALQDDVHADPNNMRARRKLADYYLKRGENLQALDQYLTVAETYADKGFFPKAVAVYKQALQIQPNMIEVYLKLATLYHKLGLMPEVVEQYQKAAAIYDTQGKEREALDIRRMMLDLDPTNVVGRLKLGQRYLEKGFVTEATNEFLRVADIFEKQGKFKELQKLLEGVLDRGLENFDILYRLVELYRGQGHTELALARLAKLHGELAGSSSTLELTAEIAEELGKPAVAVKALERASELYRGIKRADKVREVCERILQLDSENPYAVARLGELPAPPAAEAIEVEPVAEQRAEVELEEEEPIIAEVELEEEEPIIAEIELEEEEPIVVEVELEEEEPLVVEVELEEVEPLVAEVELEEEEPIVAEVELEEETPFGDEIELEAESVAEVVDIEEEPVVEEVAIEEEPVVEEVAIEEEPVVEEVAIEEEPVAEEEADEGPELVDISEMSEEEAGERLDEAIDIYLKYNLREKAIEYLELALERHPDSLLILEKLMAIHLDAGDQDNADALLAQLTDLAQQQGRADKLETYLTIMVETSPEDLNVARTLAEHYVDAEPERAIIHFFELANRYRDLDQPDEAENILDRVLEIDADNEGAHQELLDLYEHTGQEDKAIARLYTLYDAAMKQEDFAGAEGCLRRVLEHRPLDEQAQNTLLDLFQAAGETEKQIDLLRRLADRFAQAGETDRAAGFYERLLGLDPDNLVAAEHLKDLRLEQGDTEAAIAMLREIADRTADVHPEKAIDFLRELLTLDPASLDTREQLRELYLATDNPAAAINEIMVLAKAALDADDTDAALIHLGHVLELDPRHEQATRRKIAVLRELQRGAEAIEMLFALASDMERTGEIDKAEAALREVLSFDETAERARIALKDLYLGAGREDDAIEALVGLAQAAEKAEDNVAALTYWGEISGIHPANLEARQGIARLHIAAGDIDSAVAELLAVAQLREEQGDNDAAITVLEQALEYDGANEVAAARLVDLYFATHQTDKAVAQLLTGGRAARAASHYGQARDMFERVVEAEPKNITARENLKDVLIMTGRRDAAIEQLFALAGLQESADNMAAVEATYREILQLDPEKTEAAVALKDHYLAVGQHEAGLDMLFDFLQTARGNEDWDAVAAYGEEMLAVSEEDRRALTALAEASLAQDDAAGAIERFATLAALAERAGQISEAEESYGRIVALDARAIEARENLKRLCLSHGDNDGAIQQIFALADIAGEDGDAALAEAHYRAVLEIDSDNEAALENLVDLLVAAGEGAQAVPEMFRLAEKAHTNDDYSRAERYLNQILDLQQEDARALEMLCQVHIDAGDTGQAISELFQLESSAEDADHFQDALGLVERILELDGENLAGLGKKAMLQELLGQNDDAVATLRRLAEVQKERELFDEAERSLRKAQKIAPREEAIHDSLVELIEQRGDSDAVVDELLSFHRPTIEAREHEAIIELANRVLAIQPRHERAHRLLVDAHRNMDNVPAAVDALFALADVLTESEKREEAESALNEVLSLSPTDQDAVDRLSLLYLDGDRLGDAVRLLLAFGDNLQEAELHDQARFAYERALEIEDGLPEALARLKDSYLATADLAEAVDVLFRTVSSADEHGDVATAINALEEVLEHDELNIDAFEDLKLRYFRADQTDQAVALMFAADAKFTPVWELQDRIANLEELAEIDPHHYDGLRKLAGLYKENGQQEQAVDTLFRLADLARQDDDTDTAHDLLSDVIAIDGRNLPAHRRMADLYRESGDNDALAAKLLTIADLQREADDYDGSEQTLREAQSFAKFEDKALDRLLNLYTATGQDDKRLAARFEQAARHAEVGDVTEAEGIYHALLAEDAENTDAREALIVLYADNGREADAANQAMVLADRERKAEQFDDAIERYQQVLSFDEDNAKALRQLKNLLLRTERFDEVREKLRLIADRAREEDEHNEVEDALVQMLQYWPDDLDVRSELIELFEQTEQPEKAVIQLLELAEKYTAIGDVKASLKQLKRAAKMQPDNEPVNRGLADAYEAGGDKKKAVETLFHMYSLDMEAHRRHSAEKHLREILELDPDNAVAKERVFDLFKAGVTVEEKVADLLAKADEALEAGHQPAAEQSLRQILALDSKHEEARARLTQLGVAPAAPEVGIEEPVADEVFDVQAVDVQAGGDEEISIDWGEPTETEAMIAEVEAETAGELFGELEETEEDEIDVFGDVAEPAAEPTVVAREPEEELSAEEVALEAAISEADAAVAEAVEETVSEDEMSEMAIEAAFFEEADAEAAAAESWVEEQPEQADAEPAASAAEEGVDELTRAIDEFLDDATKPEPEATVFDRDEPQAEDITDVEMVEGLTSSTSEVFDKEGARPIASEEVDVDQFMLEEREAPAAAKTPTEPAKPETPSDSRVIEDFRPFTETTPDETITPESGPVVAKSDDDLMSDLIHELEEVATGASAKAEAAGLADAADDLFAGVFADAKPAGEGKAHDAFDDLLGDLSQEAGDRKEAADADADADADVFQSFGDSLPAEMRASDSARTHYELGIAFREMDSNEEAIVELEKALMKDEGTLAFEINSELGQCYSILDKYEMAVDYFESALEVAGDDAQVVLDLRFDLAVALKKMGEFADAKKLFVEIDKKSNNYRGAKAEIAECDKGGGESGGDDDNIGYL